MATTAQININVNSKSAEKSLNTLYADLEATRTELDRLVKTYGENSKQADNMRKSLVGLETEINKLGGVTDEAVSSTQSLRTELRKVTQELQQLEPGSARFVELSQRAGELRDQIQDTSAVITAVAGNNIEVFGRALTSTIQVGVAGFQALQSAQVLFGAENEELQKTLVKMGALLNLSQALETFSGLDQKLIEIRAGFTPLLTQLGLMKTAQTGVAVTTAAADAALVGEAVAADGAAVSTGFFAAALNALPLVAIVTALGLLVAGLVSYASGESEADRVAKKRIATLKAEEEEQKRASKAVAEESAQFTILIGRLKQTNAGSEERKKLITEVNSTYGTTLKNLSDETKFQESLNLELANYIAYQKAKYQLQRNEEKVALNLEKQDEIQNNINKKLKERTFYDKEIERLSKSQDPQGIEQLRQKQEELNKVIGKYQGQLEAAQKRLESYYKVETDVNDVIQEVTNNGQKYTSEVNTNTEAIDNNTDALEKQKAALQNVQALYARQIKAEKELQALQQGLQQVSISARVPAPEEDFVDRLFPIEKAEKFLKYLQEQNINIVGFTRKYYVELFNIEQSYRDKQQNLVDQATQREVEVLDQQFLEKKITEQKYFEERKRISKEGEKNLTETEQALYLTFQMLSKIDVEQYEKNWQTKEQIANESVKATNIELALLQLEYDKKRRIEELDNYKLTEEEKSKEVLQIKKEFLDTELKLIKEQLAQQVILLNRQKELELNNLDLTAAERLEINKKYEKQILQLNKTTQDTIQELTQETITQQKTLAETIVDQINKYEDYINLIAENIRTATDLISQFAQQQFENQRTQLNDTIAMNRQAIESQYAAALISREEYDNQIRQLDIKQEQDELKLKRKSFQQNKRLNVTNATIDGIRAVISTFANTPGELIIKSIAAGLAGVFAATQIALISQQQFTAADGGIVPGQGSGEYDSVPSMLAPGEAVINSQSTRAFLPLLSAINEQGGGRSFVPDLPATNQGQVFQPVFKEDKSSSQPIRAYVVESDITSSQRRVGRIERAARF